MTYIYNIRIKTFKWGGEARFPPYPPCSCSPAIAALGQNTNGILIE